MIPAPSGIRAALRVNGIETAAVATVTPGGSQAKVSTAVAVALGDLLVVNVEGAESLGASGLVRIDGATPMLYRLLASHPWEGDMWIMRGGVWRSLTGLYALRGGQWRPVRTTSLRRSGAWRTIQ